MLIFIIYSFTFLFQFGLLEIPDIDNLDLTSENDADLEAELLALTGGGGNDNNSPKKKGKH